MLEPSVYFGSRGLQHVEPSGTLTSMNTRTSTATRRRTPARRKPEPVKITQVNKGVMATAMRAAGGDAKRIKIISETQVEVTV